MKKISIFNNKGGVGKTTYMYHVAHMLCRRDLRVPAGAPSRSPQSHAAHVCNWAASRPGAPPAEELRSDVRSANLSVRKDPHGDIQTDLEFA